MQLKLLTLKILCCFLITSGLSANEADKAHEEEMQALSKALTSVQTEADEQWERELEDLMADIEAYDSLADQVDKSVALEVPVLEEEIPNLQTIEDEIKTEQAALKRTRPNPENEEWKK